MRALPLLLLALGACSAYDDDIGPTPYLCGETDPPCPEGYACQDDITTGERVCVGGGGSLSNDFDCDDDSQFEPNNLISEATPTGSKTFAQDGLSICPANDKDLFVVDIATQGEDVEITVEFQGNGAPLVAALLNTGGVPIATSDPVAGEETTKARAFAQNLPASKYYAQVAATVGDSLTLNNYSISIKITGP